MFIVMTSPEDPPSSVGAARMAALPPQEVRRLSGQFISNKNFFVIRSCRGKTRLDKRAKTESLSRAALTAAKSQVQIILRHMKNLIVHSLLAMILLAPFTSPAELVIYRGVEKESTFGNG